MIIKGKASPIPIRVKIKKMLMVDVVKAKVRAVPRNGALQGVDSIVESTPDKKSPVKLSSKWRLASFLPPGVENSNRPNILRAKMNKLKIMTIRNKGDCS